MMTAACAGAAPITVAAISNHPSAERHALDVFLSGRPLDVVSAENPFSEATVLGFSGLINWEVPLAKYMRTEPLSVGQGGPFRRRGCRGFEKRASGGAYEARLRRAATLGCGLPPFRG